MPFRYQLPLLYSTQPKPLRSGVAYTWPSAIQLLLLIARKRIMPVTVLREIRVRDSYLSFFWLYFSRDRTFSQRVLFSFVPFSSKRYPKDFFY